MLTPEIPDLQLVAQEQCTDLFELIVENVEDQQERKLTGAISIENAGILKLPIEDLLQGIENRMVELFSRAALKPDEESDTQALEDGLLEFDEKFREGLTAIHLRVNTWQQQMKADLENIRASLPA